MIPGEDDIFPQIGDTGRTLGARPHPEGGPPTGDIPVSRTGLVEPLTGGISVSPGSIEHLPPHRRPPAHGGTDRRVRVYAMETDGLPPELRARPDPNGPTRHWFIEPAWMMRFDEYQRALHATRRLWVPVR